MNGRLRIQTLSWKFLIPTITSFVVIHPQDLLFIIKAVYF